MSLLERIRFVIRASRAGRGEELDRVFAGMDRGATFTGAKAHLVLSLADSRRWVEMNMRMNHHRFLTDEMLGQAWARRVEKHIKATRTHDLTEFLEER